MPSNVAWFERLMYLQLAAGIVFGAIEWNVIVSKAPDAGAINFTLAVAGAVMAAMALLIWLTARKRQNWARWTLLVLALLGLPPFLRMLGELMRENPLAWALRIAQLGMEIVAFVFIFTGDAREWFKPTPDSIAAGNPGSPIRPQF